MIGLFYWLMITLVSIFVKLDVDKNGEINEDIVEDEKEGTNEVGDW